MANMDIVDKAIKKLTEDEFTHLKDWIVMGIKFADRQGYDKGYSAGKKYSYQNKGGTEKHDN